MENKKPGPTPEQEKKIQEIANDGYEFDEKESLKSAAIIMKKDNDVWVFGLTDGSIRHNPIFFKWHPN